MIRQRHPAAATAARGTTSNVTVTTAATLGLLAGNQLQDEGFSGSPAIADDDIHLRGSRYLYCIAAPVK